MGKTMKSARRTGGFTIGRSGFAKISAVEGLAPSRRLKEDFHEFDRLGLSAAERRRALARKYGAKG
jgi:hypothetical protein